jgi:signal transduction histidine kinase
MFDRDPVRAKSLLAEIQTDTLDALETLRDLARGIYPPVLADRGLGAALEAQARKAALPVRLQADGIGRYPLEVEAAVYFCCLESLQNVAKYAEASAAVVRLSPQDRGLRFSVTDDGAGFDPRTSSGGTGVQGMKDRLAAVGGELEITSAPGHGTTVSGWVPTA